MAPGAPPAVVGTYDFDLLGEAQGQACAEWGTHRTDSGREVLVNGKPAFFSASVAGQTFNEDAGQTFNNVDARVRQAQNAAVFTALSGLKGADVMFVTRWIVTPESTERVCAQVWGQGVRLKKGPTQGGEVAAAPTNTPPAVPDAATPQAPLAVPPAPAK